MENYKKTTDQDAIAQELASAPPTGLRVIWREFLKDKLALFSLIFFILIILGVFIGAIVIDQDEVLRISLLDSYMPPNDDFILGTDSGGRSIFGQLIIGARNSITIGFTITALTSIVGITIGLVAGYYGGIIDNFLMRIIDFIMLLPTTMLIIVFITLVSDYNVWTFILIMSAFYWVGQARLIRSKALSESRRDYISASRTMGTPTYKILFREILPNLSSLIIVNVTLSFAANIGIETGLSYLGFGLPTSTPSLGTLVSYAQSPDILENKTWVWLPASLLILVLMLCINYVGQALKRSADAKQRLG
ncbi:peptide/nickel transport system permease protein [Aerococcus sp. 150760007-1]|uniref:ABC transporter permease n=1 Tax=Aerococcus urinaeequi TaxID=51665 RepID=A0ABR5ZZM8_9LACT|nr:MULTISPECIES: ABC transporter permease [Lactobacillales]KAF3304749.1 ABC transporter permease subunit [Carnobacterium sp. PL17GRE32]MBA5747179.1 ABC transporter permease [Aerococcus urinaeequi]MBA5829963.1 ABC transporter permease [Aerococcus urinaeequi]MBA5860519.1 ABC transporter permease [Aerococcus urinaeequi]